MMLKVVEVMIWLCLENGCGGENKTDVLMGFFFVVVLTWLPKHW